MPGQHRIRRRIGAILCSHLEVDEPRQHEAEEDQADADADGYDLTVKSACSDFRIILERTVELILLNDVVIRFRREVMTKGKLIGIAKVEVKDCDLIDRMMTKYSVYEHSQADDLPQVPVELDEFERDVLELIAWMDDFKGRTS